MALGFIALLLFFSYMQVGMCVTPDSIKKEARRYIGGTKWSYASTYGTGYNTNKCNQFVYDVLRKVGAHPPRRRRYWYTPIGAGEWGNPQSSYLTESRYWNVCSGSRQVGDVIGDGVHVGIITGSDKTTSATRDSVVENDWGFRSSRIGSRDSISGCWRYNYILY